MANRKRGLAGFPPISQGGLRVRLFSSKDLPELASIAGQPLIKGIDRKEVVERLNLAFFSAHDAAERARAALAPAELEAQAGSVLNLGCQLLEALGFPSEPRAYTTEGIFRHGSMADDIFRRSPIAARLRHVEGEIQPLPVPRIMKDLWELNEAEQQRIVMKAMREAERIPLSDQMVPLSIAKRTVPVDWIIKVLNPVAHSVAEETGRSFEEVQAELIVRQLLDMAPSAIAALVSRAEMLVKTAGSVRTHKQNYGRTFTWSLFYWLARAYFHAFGRRPNTSDNERGPKGPATLWVDRVLKIAEARSDQIAAVRVKHVVLADETERERLIRAIRATAQLKISVKAKRLAEGWRLREKFEPASRRPELP